MLDSKPFLDFINLPQLSVVTSASPVLLRTFMDFSEDEAKQQGRKVFYLRFDDDPVDNLMSHLEDQPIDFVIIDRLEKLEACDLSGLQAFSRSYPMPMLGCVRWEYQEVLKDAGHIGCPIFLLEKMARLFSGRDHVAATEMSSGVRDFFEFESAPRAGVMRRLGC